MVGAGVLAAFGATYLLQAIVQLLSTRMPRWLASLLTGVSLLLAAGVLVQQGRQKFKDDVVPDGDDQASPA